VVHLQIAEIPGGRSAAERELVAEIDIGDESNSSRPAPGLERAKNAARVQIREGLGALRGLFGLRGAAAKRRHHGRARPIASS